MKFDVIAKHRVEHAFDDLKARQWIEAKLRADETINATRKGLADCAADIDAGYQQQVEQALKAIESILAAEDPQTKIGDPVKLKAATTALDEATKPLADIMMDKAMEAMLRKRGLIQ